ncbi:transposable element Tcb1 transposase [Trichonephila clavipes]|nr:transposable element Tcb1 transposase [Trichonephila clavipes]
MIELLDDWNVDVPSWKYPRNLESPRVSSPGFVNDSKMMVINRRSTETDLSRQLSSATGTTVSRQIVYRHLGHIGLYARRPVRCVPLTTTHAWHDCAMHVLLESMVFQERMSYGEPTEARLEETLQSGKEYLPQAMHMTDQNSVRWQTMYHYVKSGFPRHNGNSSQR